MRLFLLSLFLFALAACGGGGGGGGGSDAGIEYSFNLTNRVAQAYPAKCSNDIVSAELKFSAEGIQFLRGTDSVNQNPDGTCTANRTPNAEIGVVFSYIDAKNDGFLIPCGGPKCTLAQLNSTYTGIDSDGRAWTQVVSHIANSNEIVSTKSWYQNQTQHVSKITLKFVDDGYVIDLANKTASVSAMGCTPPIIAFKSVFTQSGMGFTEGTDSTDPGPNGSCISKPTPTEEVGLIFAYAELKKDGFLIPCGSSICTYWELNGTYSGVDSDGRQWTQVVTHTKDTKTILSTKNWVDNGTPRSSTAKIVFD